ncbi:hypothetical protein BWI96_00020 [Siphonobacter sp. SORGH_AS_0500]|uniref:hypothetical protein n=1 Tax=Siphonobacter sp. SORGH_AS_0500 TaxID=1864824 RepID=UPI000CC9E1DE|nr:hypothetical protein [Siphonobacter sp. SORGH_AS_0500]PKK38222.1 hypothetical protein BWI96_00020 [Siphonobacter sp. SORGH_AS_0500]
MAILFTSCSYDKSMLQELSNAQLLTRKSKLQQIGLFMLILLVVIVGSAFILESYFVAATSWAIIPALMEYGKKRKALFIELQNRKEVN